ncbi:MAG: UDP-N-acetylmuramoyl-L-alanine--D-glutamate ligase, partial [Candidatus Dormibacteria bacterium]
LIAAVLQRGPQRVLLGGNIGDPVIDRLDDVTEQDWVVLELSSFQIETIAEPRCAIACVLNVTPDHLDRHGTFEAYAAIKARIVRYARETAVLGYDDAVTRDMARQTEVRVRFFGADIGTHDGAAVRDGAVVTVEDGIATDVMPVEAVPLFGAHNVLNVLAAVATSRAAAMPVNAIADAVRAFHAVAHRLEVVADAGGILWVNDSKATNAESAIVALRAFGDRPIVWIAGGTGASEVPGALLDEVAAHVRVAVLNGESAAQLDAALAERGVSARRITRTLADAVRVAHEVARARDVVLLSPAYKSFDQFRDFEHRGDVFRDLVRSLVDAEASTV